MKKDLREEWHLPLLPQVCGAGGRLGQQILADLAAVDDFDGRSPGAISSLSATMPRQW